METFFKKQFIGCSAALVLGILSIIAGLSNIANVGDDKSDNLIAGIIITIGALSYCSLKKRKIGLSKFSKSRVFLELVALLAIIMLVVFRNNLFDTIYYQPFTYVIIPIWAVVAYLVLYFKK